LIKFRALEIEERRCAQGTIPTYLKSHCPYSHLDWVIGACYINMGNQIFQ